MKLGKKIVHIAVPVFCLSVLCGCQSSDPALRSNSTEYGDIISDVCLRDKSTLTISITMGDGLFASADGGGDSQHTTPTQTTETSPQAAAAWGGSSAGVGGEQRTDAVNGLDKILKAVKEGKKASLSAAEKEAVQGCLSGSCGESGACSE